MTVHNQHALEAHCTLHAWQNIPLSYSPIVIGVDEVGRGSLFGQMTVAAVILPPTLTGEFGGLHLTDTPLQGLNDSKKLSAKKRTGLFEKISTICQSAVIVDVPASVIDDINIYQATLLGMRLALERMIMLNKISTTQDISLLIDGNARPAFTESFAIWQDKVHTMVRGDGIHSSIAAASILAKVHRDRHMTHCATIYPGYHLDKHKGYASAAHLRAITTLGILPEHRKSFNPMRTMLGQ